MTATKPPLWQIEFTDYPADSMPDLPAGWVDSSWHNDVCPSFENTALGLVLYVDHPDPNEREHGPETPRYSLHRWDEESLSLGESFLASEAWEDISDAVAGAARSAYAENLAKALAAVKAAQTCAEAAGADGARHLPWASAAFSAISDALTYARAKPLDEIID